MVDARRKKQISEFIAQLSAEFIQEHSNRKSLITVVRAEVAPNLSVATVFISVLPDSMQQEALHFVRRKADELRNYIKKNSKLRKIPFIKIEIDKGEKNRQAVQFLQ